jgi:hypothetical protein
MTLLQDFNNENVSDETLDEADINNLNFED